MKEINIDKLKEQTAQYAIDHVTDILKIADPLSKRHLVANRVSIDCIYKLSPNELIRLDEVLGNLEKNPNYGMNHK